MLMKPNESVLSFMICIFVSDLRNFCLIQGKKNFLLFSAGSFIVLAFTFRSMIHVEFIFVYGVRKGPRLISFLK